MVNFSKHNNFADKLDDFINRIFFIRSINMDEKLFRSQFPRFEISSLEDITSSYSTELKFMRYHGNSYHIHLRR